MPSLALKKPIKLNLEFKTFSSSCACSAEKSGQYLPPQREIVMLLHWLTPARAAMLAVPVLVSSFAASQASAHGPTRQKVEESVTLNATPDKVWAVIGNFHDMSWNPAVASATGDGGNKVTSLRTLTLKASGKPITESLDKYDATEHLYKTFLTKPNPDALPANDLSTELSVSPAAGGKSTVEWNAAFYRGYMNNDPPPNLNDEASKKAVADYMKAGLAALKAKFGG
ncbi:Hypothetical protein GbCGDNIH7_0203 [Granulibacter bethesdensis]|nr:Hypothetical protein GbCGDNIH7_0203 [Granulibacter bethesdensis]